MDIIRYDGTRFITEEEIDREFTGKWALIRFEGEDIWDGGYLVAIAEDRPGNRAKLEEIAIFEYDSNAQIKYGCKTRGEMIRVQLLD